MRTIEYFIPRYGNWGGPGWSGGVYNDDPSKTDWTVPGIDAMDELFKEHDRVYQTQNMDRSLADEVLVKGLRDLHPSDFSLWANLYRYGAIFGFTIRYSIDNFLEDL